MSKAHQRDRHYWLFGLFYCTSCGHGSTSADNVLAGTGGVAGILFRADGIGPPKRGDNGRSSLCGT